MNEVPRYSMSIKWSQGDGVFIVSFPEWENAGHIANTHGATYEEVVSQGREALELLVESTKAIGAELPAPEVFAQREAV